MQAINNIPPQQKTHTSQILKRYGIAKRQHKTTAKTPTTAKRQRLKNCNPSKSKNGKISTL
jgi:hypothetical protein